MKKIKIIDNFFEIPYSAKKEENNSEEKLIIDRIISLLDTYSCFVVHDCVDSLFSDFEIINYTKISKFKKIIEVKKFTELNEEMFEYRFVSFYFMDKGYSWNQFVCNENKFLGGHNARVSLTLDEFGLVYISYNPMYDKQIREIIGEENIKKSLFEILRTKIKK
ncbi:MAG: hypothetical protein NC483_07625 [Ruminococcus sp.]|nr:hypothetical protein [Ruminococcus sp.]